MGVYPLLTLVNGNLVNEESHCTGGIAEEHNSFTDGSSGVFLVATNHFVETSRSHSIWQNVI